MQSARELFEHELADTYDAEKRMLDALKKMADKVADPDLSSAFETHRKETEEQVHRIEEVFQMMGRKPEAETCYGMQGLIKEFSVFADHHDASEDVLALFAAKASVKAELYEVSGYGALIELAVLAGETEAAKLLEQSMLEERKTLEQMQAMSHRLGERLAGTGS